MKRRRGKIGELSKNGDYPMLSIVKCSLPDNALLASYSRDGTYTDCYSTDIIGAISHVEFVIAFYTTLIFKLERVILKWAVSKPSTDAQARLLAEGTINNFAAWYVESRSENQILMSDFWGRTRSWLMVTPLPAGNGTLTRLYFGSAVVPVQNPKSGIPSLGLGFHALLGFHKVYSQVLLYSAKSRLKARRP